MATSNGATEAEHQSPPSSPRSAPLERIVGDDLGVLEMAARARDDQMSDDFGVLKLIDESQDINNVATGSPEEVRTALSTPLMSGGAAEGEAKGGDDERHSTSVVHSGFADLDPVGSSRSVSGSPVSSVNWDAPLTGGSVNSMLHEVTSPLGFSNPFSPEEIPKGPRGGAEARKSRRWTVNVPSLSHFGEGGVGTEGGQENIFSNIHLPPVGETGASLGDQDANARLPQAGAGSGLTGYNPSVLAFLDPETQLELNDLVLEEARLRNQLHAILERKRDLLEAAGVQANGADVLGPPPPPPPDLSPPSSPSPGPLAGNHAPRQVPPRAQQQQQQQQQQTMRRFSAYDASPAGWAPPPGHFAQGAGSPASLRKSNSDESSTVASNAGGEDNFPVPTLQSAPVNGSSWDGGRSRRHTVGGNPPAGAPGMPYSGFYAGGFDPASLPGGANGNYNSNFYPSPHAMALLQHQQQQQQQQQQASDSFFYQQQASSPSPGHRSHQTSARMGSPLQAASPSQGMDAKNQQLRSSSSASNSSISRPNAPSSPPPSLQGQQQQGQQQQRQPGAHSHPHPHGGQPGNGLPSASKQATGPPGANIFVFNFPRSFEDKDLEAAFAPFGNILSATVFIDKVTGKSKCFGFVSYDVVESAQQAIATMNGAALGGKVVKVQIKRERSARNDNPQDHSMGS